jgi:acetyl-CoA synthetase
MSGNESSTWYPGRYELASSGIAELMRALGAARYEDLLDIAIREPHRYWDTETRHCAVVWQTPPQAYLHPDSRPEFPRWFPCARLNWVDTALAKGRRPQTAQ